MNLNEVFPHQVCVNLGDREDRRREAWAQFAKAGLHVERQPGIAKEWVLDSWGYLRPSRYACSLAKRLAVRRAKLSGAPAMILFEDDLVLAPDLHERLAEIELPDDWGIFFLGCKHLEKPVPMAPGLVKVVRAADHHAMAIRAEYYNAVIRGLAGIRKGAEPSIRFSDVKMSDIQATVPTYAAYPNLAWQAVSFSDNAGRRQSFYDLSGRQRSVLHAIDGLEEEMKNIKTGEAVRLCDEPTGITVPGSGDLALIQNQTSPEKPGIENVSPMDGKDDDEPPTMGFLKGTPRRFRIEEMFPMRLYINLARREERRHEIEWRFENMGLAVERLPAADGRLARNTRGHGPPNKYACRLSHRMALREGLRRDAPSVLVFEDDAVFHPDFRNLVEALPPPEDWGVLLFGCTHVRPPEVAAPGWVKVRHFWGLHAYAVRRCWFRKLLSALNGKGMPRNSEGSLGTDVAYSQLADQIPIYATYPNLSWQDDGYSDLMGIERKPFRPDGHQNRLLHVLRETNIQMKECIAAEFGEEILVPRDHGLLGPGEVFGEVPTLAGKWNLDQEFEMALFLNLAEREDRKTLVEERFRKAGVSVNRFPAVKGIRGPRTGKYAR